MVWREREKERARESKREREMYTNGVHMCMSHVMLLLLATIGFLGAPCYVNVCNYMPYTTLHTLHYTVHVLYITAAYTSRIEVRRALSSYKIHTIKHFVCLLRMIWWIQLTAKAAHINEPRHTHTHTQYKNNIYFSGFV